MATAKETVVPLCGHGSGVHGHSFSADVAPLISGGNDASARLWHVAIGREMLVVGSAFDQRGRLPFLSPQGELLVWRDSGQNLRTRLQPIPTLAGIEKAHGAESSAR